MTILFALLTIVVGLALVFEGYRLARFFIPLLGFLTGLSFGGAIIAGTSSTPFLRTLLGIFLGIAMGLVFAALAYFSYYLAVIVLAAGLGYWAGSGFILLLGFRPGILSALAGIAVGIVVGVLAVLARAPKYVLVILTSIAGAVSTIGGVMLLFGQIPLEVFNYHTARVALSNSFLWSLMAIALFIVGLVTQIRSASTYEFEEWATGNDHTHHPTPPTTHVTGGAR